MVRKDANNTFRWRMCTRIVPKLQSRVWSVRKPVSERDGGGVGVRWKVPV